MNELSQGQYWYFTIAVAIASFVAGQLLPRMLMTRKEKKDFEQANYINTKNLLENHATFRDAYYASIQNYCDATFPTVELLTDIALNGDRYFDNASFIASSILSRKVDPQVRDNFLLPKIEGMSEKTLPAHYDTLNAISLKLSNKPYGPLVQKNYRSIYKVTKKYKLDKK